MELTVAFGLILLMVTVGPLGAVPYAIDHGMSILQAAAIVCSLNVALVPVWFGVMELFGYSRRYQKYLTNRALEYVAQRSAEFRRNIHVYVTEFEKHLGHIGFFIALTILSFIFGVVWSTMGAYFLNVKRAPALISISIGAIGNAVLFGLTSVGILKFMPSPKVLYLSLMALTGVFLFYGKIRETRVLRSVLHKLGRKG